MKNNVTSSDVNIVNLHDNVQYIHVQFHMRIGKEELLIHVGIPAIGPDLLMRGRRRDPQD